VVAVAVAVYLLLPRLAQSSTGISQLTAGRLPWLVAVAGASALTYVMAATALTAATHQPLVLGRTIAVQLAGTCANRVTPAGLGAAAVNIRYLELSGLDRPEAAATVAVTATSGFAVHSAAVVALALVLGHGGPALHVPVIDPDWPGVLALALVLGAGGWLIWVHRLHQPVWAWLKAGAVGLAALIEHPGRGALLLGASAGISLGYILALDASLLAFGVHLGLGPVAAVYLGSSAIGAVAPTPGGVGPFEAAVVTGLSAYGVAGGPAVAAVIAYRLITYWLPVAPGAVLLHLLRRSGTL
jgi:glycosyltransferase 2 family protein